MRKLATLALLGALAIPVTFAAAPKAEDQTQTQKPRKHKKNKKQKHQNPDTEKKEG